MFSQIDLEIFHLLTLSLWCRDLNRNRCLLREFEWPRESKVFHRHSMDLFSQQLEDTAYNMSKISLISTGNNIYNPTYDCGCSPGGRESKIMVSSMKLKWLVFTTIKSLSCRIKMNLHYIVYHKPPILNLKVPFRGSINSPVKEKTSN